MRTLQRMALALLLAAAVALCVDLLVSWRACSAAGGTLVRGLLSTHCLHCPTTEP